jgi:YbbR domain-containing protein
MRLRDLFLKSPFMKLLSLGLASLIWFTVNKSINNQVAIGNPLSTLRSITTNLPVLIVAAAADVRDFQVQPTTVAVTLQGRPEVLNQLDARDVRVEVFLTDIESAKALRKRVDVFPPPGTSVLEVSPAEVDVVVPPRK